MHSLRKILFISILLAAALSVNSIAGTPGPKNESTIRHKNELKYSRNVCSGRLNDAAILRKIGIQEADLKKGVECIVGDFDGNGYLDFAIYGRIIRAPQVIDHPEALGVVFFERSSVLKTQILSDQHFSAPELYPATTKEGAYGEPASATDGIVQWGEGGTTVICLYQPDAAAMKCGYYLSELK